MTVQPIECQDFSFMYHKSEYLAVKQINLSVDKGKFYLLAGPTGSGKTTLIRAINGLIPHFYHGRFFGYVKIEGKDTLEMTPAKLASSVGTVFQNPENQLFSMSVERELTFSLENLGFSREQISKQINHAINLTKIDSFLKKSPYELSGGEQQRVAIASVLALNPEIIILDEPLSNLDPATATEIAQLLESIQKHEGKTVILSEHRLEYLLDVVDSIIVIHQGKIKTIEPPSVLLQQDLLYDIGIDLPLLYQWFYIQIRKIEHLNENSTYRIPCNENEQLQWLKNYCHSNLDQKYLVRSYFNSEETPLMREENRVTEPILTVQNLNFSYEIEGKKLKKHSSHKFPFRWISKKRNEKMKKFFQTLVLNDINAQFYPGEVVSLLGKNGAGKSTFVRCLTNLLNSYMGKVILKGTDTQQLPSHEITRVIGLMFQNPDHQLFLNSVEAELEFSLKNLNLTPKEQDQRIFQTLNQLDIQNLRKFPPFSVSGGQKKKIALATILCRNPEILIFDEPTIGQDAQQKQKLLEIIRKAQSEQKLIIIISHDIEFILQVSTRILVMDQGRILADDKPTNIFHDKALLNKSNLRQSTFMHLYEKLRAQIPDLPPDILSITQLERYLSNVTTNH
ncbi:MAG: ABC transporter ATP-binding protein [Promethearchaeota archaeon]